jgi:hypothetical protein
MKLGSNTLILGKNISITQEGPLDAHTYWNTLEEALDTTLVNGEAKGIPLKSRIKGFKFVVRDDGTGQPAEYWFKEDYVKGNNFPPNHPNHQPAFIPEPVPFQPEIEIPEPGAKSAEELPASVDKEFKYGVKEQTQYEEVVWTDEEVDDHNANLCNIARQLNQALASFSDQTIWQDFFIPRGIEPLQYGHITKRVIKEAGDIIPMSTLEYADRSPGAECYSKQAFLDKLAEIGNLDNKNLLDGIYYVKGY